MISLDGPTLKLGIVAGIPIKVHWTFSLFIAFIIYIAFSNQIASSELIWFFAYVLLLFVFVVMHEYGHALTARRFGIRTRDIILSPIGGIARLERLPFKPYQELLVAIAGPAVNVVLVVIFLCWQLMISDRILPPLDRIDLSFSDDFIGYLLWINIMLFIFNLLPAFPMDGGRVLRSLLAMIMKNRLKATKWAVIIGQVMALGFIFIGFQWERYILLFIGLFVFFTARIEYRQMKLFYRMSETKLKDVMRKNYTLLKPTDTLSKVLEFTDEQNFLITNEEGRVIGSLPQIFIKRASKELDKSDQVSSFMSSTFGALNEDLSLAKTFNILNERGWAIAQVIDIYGNKKGVIDRQLLLDFMRNNQ